MATLETMNLLLPPQQTFTRLDRAYAHVDHLQLSDQFWQAVKLDSPASPTFDPSLIDEKILPAIHVDETTTTFVDDPIVAFETLDAYSPNRPRFTPTAPPEYSANDNSPPYQPCPFGEPLGLCTSPSLTLGSIRYSDKSPSRSASPWAAMTLRPTRFRKRSISTSSENNRHHHQHAPNSVLALASAFLDSIVRLTRSRAATPTALSDAQAQPGVTILESEVLINVLEDGKRAAMYGSTSLCGDVAPLEKLDIPPLSAMVAGGANWWDPGSPMTAAAEGPAECSRQLDTVGRFDWEWQLSGTEAQAFGAGC